MKILNKQLLVHVLACLAFLSVPILLSPDTPTMGIWNNRPMLNDLSVYPFMIIFFYLNYFYLIPKVYFAKRYVTYVLVAAVCFGVIMLLHSGANQIVHACQGPQMPSAGHQPPQFGGGGHPPDHNGYRWLFDFSHYLFLFLVVLFFSLLLKINNRWRQAEKDKVSTELSYLKAQVNPHFLFNTLNSIYGLALSKSDQTATAVVKLSGMMRYVLSETNVNYVTLEKEINYVTDYIELQKMRLGNTVQLSYDVSGILTGKLIAPLLLIPFIENAFKHGVNPEENSRISINIEVMPHELILSVENNKVGAIIDEDEASGLGIPNAKTTLQMLYPDKHRLTITDNESEYKVHLTIALQ